MTTTKLTAKQRDAILAGLRLLQFKLESGWVIPDDELLHCILTNGGAHEGVTVEEIDTFCKELNK